MIDAARALAASLAVAEDSASDLANHVVREIERLEALRMALAAFIDSPGQESVGHADGPPAPVPPSATPAIDSPGQVRSAHAPEGSPAPAAPERGRSGVCPVAGYGKAARHTGRHRRPSSEIVANNRARRPSPGPDPIARAEAAEASLAGPLGADVDRRTLDPAEKCNRNCGRSFTWEPSLITHQQTCSGARRTPPPPGEVIPPMPLGLGG